MNLFNRRLIKQAIEKSHFIVSEKDTYTIDIITRIQNFLIKDENRSKEKSIQSLYLQRIFEEILGYPSQLSGLDEYNLIVEPTTDYDSTEPDGALGFFGKKEKAVKAVIELKPAGTDLDKKQTSRKDQKSPVEQGFGYSYKFDGCKWVIVSNFTEIRLYNTQRGIGYYDNFDIFKLNDENEFIKFYFLLSKKNFISKSDNSAVDLLIKETNIQEENITKEFYKKYKNIRIKLYNHIIENNPQIDKYLILEKVQKIIDRVIFICFCEDLGLLPYNIFRNILKNIESSFDLSDTKIWSQVKGLFHFINQGNSNKDINRFNGGLFAEDPILDNLVIQDGIIKELIQISNYNFESDLNVNILGHIFEQSIADIEEMKADISEKIIESTKGKRKKEGIYYTPEYITKYIVENALGNWLKDKKEELGFYRLPGLNNEDYLSIKITKKHKFKANNKIKEHVSFWEKYRDLVKNIKVLDPACGSGAFLTQVFDFLYKEGQIINDGLSKFKKGQKQIFDLDKHILTNNIYGIDLNEESVQITKLSLWLKTANKEKELTALDDNIKCGNSIIDDSRIIGKRAFNWSNEFKDILNNGGFDIVIGNPPYVRQESIKNIKIFLKDNYKTYSSSADLYIYFIEKGLNLLNKNGYFSYIISNKFTKANYGKNIRKFISHNFTILEYVSSFSDKVFEDSNVDPCIIVIKKEKPSRVQNIYINKFVKTIPKLSLKSNQKYLGENSWSFSATKHYDLKDKIEKKGIKIKDWENIFINLGIKTGLSDAFIIPSSKKDSILENNPDSITLIKPILRGRDINQYKISNPNLWLILIPSGWTKCVSKKNLSEIEAEQVFEKHHPYLFKHLLDFKEKLQKRCDKGEFWFELRPCKYYNFFIEEKIIYPDISQEGCFYWDEYNFYITNTAYMISNAPKYWTAILNSKLISWYYKLIATNLGKSGIRYFVQFVKEIPIIKLKKDIEEKLNQKIEEIQFLKDLLDKKTIKALNLLSSEYAIKKVSTNLKNFYNLGWNDFIKKIIKLKSNLTLVQKDELQEWYYDKMENLKKLQDKIYKVNNEINQEVYKLYDLSEEEVKVVENSS